MLLPRTINIQGVQNKVNANDILASYKQKQSEFQQYSDKADLVKLWNEGISYAWVEPETNYRLPLPPRPSQFSGRTFQNTDTLAGYGALTAGMYRPSAFSGYKAFGSIGQSKFADDVHIAIDKSDKSRYMLVTLYVESASWS
jgi:hypothetical protein